MMPGGMEVRVEEIENLDEYEKPLIVSYFVQGAIGSPTGKRLLFTGDLFEANATPTFPHDKRDVPVYFQYPSSTRDAVRVTFPASFSLESAPAQEQDPFGKSAVYSLSSESTKNSVTVRRDFIMGEIIFPPTDYPALRAFYGKLEAKDQEPAVLKIAAAGGN